MTLAAKVPASISEAAAAWLKSARDSVNPENPRSGAGERVEMRCGTAVLKKEAEPLTERGSGAVTADSDDKACAA